MHIRGVTANAGEAVPLRLLQDSVLWIFIASGFLVLVEPSPFEILFPLLVFVFLPFGLRLTGAAAPLVVFLLLYNLGGVASLVPYLGDDVGERFVAISFFMALNAVFFAALVAEETVRHLRTIRGAWIMAALLASVAEFSAISMSLARPQRSRRSAVPRAPSRTRMSTRPSSRRRSSFSCSH